MMREEYLHKMIEIFRCGKINSICRYSLKHRINKLDQVYSTSNKFS